MGVVGVEGVEGGSVFVGVGGISASISRGSGLAWVGVVDVEGVDGGSVVGEAPRGDGGISISTSISL